MSTTIQNKQATSSQGGFSTVGQRRIKYGTNVLIMCIAALVIVALVNLVSFRKHWRKDMAAVGSFEPSERTKRIIDDIKGKISLTSVYTSTQEENSRDKYLPAVEDYCEELQQYAPGKIDVEHVANDAQKAALLARIQGKYSTQAKAYADLIDEYDTFAGGTKEQGKVPTTQPALPQMRQALAELSAALNGKDSYLGSFPQMADTEAKLSKAIENLSNAPAEMKRLTKSGGIPRYAEARDKIKQTLDSLRDTLAGGAKSIKNIAEVSQATGEEFFTTAPQRMEQMNALMVQLQDTIGKPEDRDLPADTREALQAYARESQKLATWLNEEAGKEEALAKKYPAIADMPNWLVQQNMGIIQQIIPLPGLLRSISEQQTNVRQQVREMLAAKQAIAPDELAGAIRKLRQLVAQHMSISKAVASQIVKLSGVLSKTDQASLAILEQGKGGQWMADVISRIDAMKEQIAKLPELKLTDVTDKLEAPNTIIAEMGDKMQVLTFDEVWPQSEPMRMPGSNDIPRRAFNGDTVVSGALLSLSQPPVATVVFVHFAGELPQQMRQYMAPPVGSIPYPVLEGLRGLMAKSNLAVKEWNLAKEDNPPQPEKGTQNIYVVLPPPDQLPGPTTEKWQFNDTQIAKVKKVLAGGAKSIFLCKWEMPKPRFPGLPPEEPKYRYTQLLHDTFGVDVSSEYRTIYGVLESREGSKYGVNVQRWVWMPLNNFSDLPMGKPLQGRRVLMTDVCPVEAASKVPDGLKVEPILSTPSNEEYWATRDVMDLIRSVVSEKQGGLVTQGPNDRKSPYSVAVAVLNAKNQPLAAVLGTGASVMDGYMNERVPRLGGRDQSMRYDPAPTANGDLMINSVLWLAGRSDLIGAGPVILPPVRPIAHGQMLAIYALVWGILPGLVILSGAAMWVARRR